MSDLGKLKMKIDLLMARVEILKLKADEYTWACHTPDETKNALNATLQEIDAVLKEL